MEDFDVACKVYRKIVDSVKHLVSKFNRARNACWGTDNLVDQLPKQGWKRRQA